MNTKASSFVFVSLLLIVSCSDNGADVGLGSGAYQYVGYLGKSMQVVHRGWLTITIRNSSVTGEWQFNNQERQQLEGRIQSGEYFLNLNPRFVDNNLFLRGRAEGRRLRGEWSQVGFPGVMAEGTFIAERK